MNSKTTHIVFIFAVVAAGLLSGFLNMPGEWYRGLAKPPFNPPDWLFAPAWTLLYIFIGWAGARSFLRREDNPAAYGLWVTQIVLNLAWMPVFFGLHMMVPALFVIVVLLAVIIAFILRTRHADRLSAGLFVLYALWVAFATLLNAALIYLN